MPPSSPGVLAPALPLALRLGLALALGLLAPPVAANAPSGIYEIEFSGSESIWPLSDFQDCESDVIDGIDVDICLAVSFVRDSRGQVNGSGTFDFNASGIGVDIRGNLAGTLKGSVKGTDRKGSKQTVSLKYKGAVSVSGAGSDLPATMTGKLTTSVSTAGITETTGSVKVDIKRGRTTRAKLQTGLAQLPEGGGDWTLRLIIAPSADRSKLSGTAELMLPDGSRFLPISGKYKSKQDTSDIQAKGKASNKGIQIDLKGLRSSDIGTPEEPGRFDRGSARYDVQGHSGKKSLK